MIYIRLKFGKMCACSRNNIFNQKAANYLKEVAYLIFYTNYENPKQNIGD